MPERTAPWTEPVRQRLRAWRDGRLLVDTCRAQLYFPDERHPRWAVPAGDLLVPAPGAFSYDGLAVLSPDDADTWVEEDRQTYGDPRNPYHRVDTLPSSRHVQVLAGQTIVAETSRPVLLIETGTRPRWYIPPGDVAWAQLEPDPARTTCQYKGEATYFRVRNTDVRLWTYRHPDPEAAAIAGPHRRRRPGTAVRTQRPHLPRVSRVPRRRPRRMAGTARRSPELRRSLIPARPAEPALRNVSRRARHRPGPQASPRWR